jgi:hypothetical protein
MGWRRRLRHGIHHAGSPTDFTRPNDLRTKRSIDEKISRDAAAAGHNAILRHHPGKHSLAAERKWHQQPGLHANHYGVLGFGDRAVKP